MELLFDKYGYNDQYNVFKSRYLADKAAKKKMQHHAVPFWEEDSYIIIRINKYYKIVWYFSELDRK